MFCKKDLSKKDGISIIILVVTIIVMVILAGVVIRFATTGDGIINQTVSATKKETHSETMENVQDAMYFDVEKRKVDLKKTMENINALRIEKKVADLESIQYWDSKTSEIVNNPSSADSLYLTFKNGKPIMITIDGEFIEEN